MPSYLPLNALAIALLLSVPLSAQFTDDFEDGDLTSNPTWQGDPDDFVIEDGQLRLMAPEEDGTRSLYTASEAIDNATWRFVVMLDFNPSSSNYCDVHLVADGIPLENSSGYFVRIGDTENEISLYRQDEGSPEIIIDGTDDVVDVSDVEAAVEVTRDDQGNWTLAFDTDGAPYEYEQDGTATDQTYASSNRFGLRCIYTSTRSDRFYFDDFEVMGDPFTDTEPPELSSLEVLSDQEIELVFNEPIDQASGENISNYSLSAGIGSPQAANLQPDEQTIILEFDSQFQSATTYELTINNVTDQAGNPIAETTDEFTYYNFGVPTAGDVVFNEVMADPNPPVSLPEAEYAEVYNTTDSYFNLEGWSYVNSTSSTPLPSYILAPGEAVAICAEEDSAAISAFGPVIGLPGFTALSNSGDSLTLLDGEEEILDILVYSDDWYDDPDKDDGGWSIERINPFTPCNNDQNWTASLAPLGGTPGTGNSVFDPAPDETAPSAIDAYAPDAGTVIISSDEALDNTTLNNLTVIISPEIAIDNAVLSGSGNQVVLFLQQELEFGITYEVQTSGLTDCAGNVSEEETLSIFIAPAPAQHEVLINEIMADPTPAISLPEAEYIELLNTTGESLDLSDCQLNDLEFQQGSIIDSAEYILLCAPENQELLGEFGEVFVLEEMSESYITNSGRELLLTCGENVQIDGVEFTEAWYNDAEKDDGGWSLERMNPEEPCREASNWSASESNQGGTPGEQNSIFSSDPDQEPPQLERVYPDSTLAMHLVFNEVLDSASASSAVIMTDPDLEIDSVYRPAGTSNELVVVWLQEPADDVVYMISISGVADCTGNTLLETITADFGIPAEAQEGDVIINEVLFDPRTGGAEFVELYNRTSKIIDLQGWIVGSDAGEPPGTFPEVSGTPFLLLPNDFALLTDDPANVNQEYPMGRPDRYLGMESFPSLSNGEGTVVVYNSGEDLVDQLDYTDDMHFPLLDNTDGVSLERISYYTPTQNLENWTSASEQVGFATPGYENSQHIPGGAPQGDFKLVSDVVSPDNDGYEDNLVIQYELDRSGFVGNVTILTERGSPVRELYNNYLLGKEGELIWNGLTDEGEKAPIGVYAIFIEIFRPQGDVREYVLPCVVAGRF